LGIGWLAADDSSRMYEIAATRAGRRVEITTGRGIVEVTEVTRTGDDSTLSHLLRLLRDDATQTYDHYLEMLNEDEAGQPRDAARSAAQRGARLQRCSSRRSSTREECCTICPPIKFIVKVSS
jgi:hypothetical protein